MKNITEFFDALKQDMDMMGEDTETSGGVIRTMLTGLGVNGTNAIMEALVEAEENGDDLPYPVIRFHITLAKDIDQVNFRNVTYTLNQLNNVIASGEYPSFGNFALYMPLGQIFLTYRMPINIGALDADYENVRFFLATVFDQLDIFADMILYISEGYNELTVEQYMEYLKSVEDWNNLQERADRLSKLIEGL